MIFKLAENAVNNAGVLRDATRSGNLSVVMDLMGPAVRGLLLQKAKGALATELNVASTANFTWNYEQSRPELQKLYHAGVSAQWDARKTLDWSTQVDPLNERVPVITDNMLPLRELPAFRKLPARTQQRQRAALLSWIMSQFLHGEQGALYVACQVTQTVQDYDAKLYGSTQVMDEARHVDVFNRYLTEKLEKKYEINDNLYVILDALMTDGRWDIKFLGMQIMIEGLALGSFGTLRKSSKEPLLRELLKYVMMDEGRHVHFGVVALEECYVRDLPESERREREDWAYEMALFLRNRFLGHEFYEEYYAHSMSRFTWDRFILESEYMKLFREQIFRKLMPNLRRIGLLSDRVRPFYEQIGLLMYEHEKAANEMTQEELVADSDGEFARTPA